MPRDGAGTYNAPEATVVTGTPISSTSYNASLADIGTALTGSVARDGQSPMTAPLPMGNNRITGLANGVTATDGAAVGQVVLTSGANPMMAALPMGNNRITGLANGVTATDGAAVGQVVLTSGANAMMAALPMGNNRITGLANGVTATDGAAVGQVVLTSGANPMIGDLTISKVAPRIVVDRTGTGSVAAVVGSNNGSTRWELLLGDNSFGTNFSIDRFTDGGVYIDSPLVITRTIGEPIFADASLWRAGLNVPASPALLGFQHIATAPSGIWALPAGGTWAYSVRGFEAATGASNFQFVSNVAAGGTPIISSPGVVFEGFAWRIA